MALPTLDPFPPGYSDNIFRFGRAEGLAAATESLVWNGGGAYNGILSSGSSLTVVSDSVEDADGETGAIDLVLFYQTEDYTEYWTTVELTGTTPVVVLDRQGAVLSADISYTAWVVTSAGMGFGEANVGNITCYQTDTPANILWHIKPGEGQTLMCLYRVPKAKIFEVHAIDAFPQGNQPVVMRVRVKSRKDLPWRDRAIGDALDAAIPVALHDNPQPARAGSYISITATPANPATDVSAYFAGRLKDAPEDAQAYYGGSLPF